MGVEKIANVQGDFFYCDLISWFFLKSRHQLEIRNIKIQLICGQKCGYFYNSEKHVGFACL